MEIMSKDILLNVNSFFNLLELNKIFKYSYLNNDFLKVFLNSKKNGTPNFLLLIKILQKI